MFDALPVILEIHLLIMRTTLPKENIKEALGYQGKQDARRQHIWRYNDWDDPKNPVSSYGKDKNPAEAGFVFKTAPKA
jgi:hypothetical protein